MSNLTTDNLKSILKENNEVLMKEVRKEIRPTVKNSEISLKKYMAEYVSDAADRVLNTMQEMFDERDIVIKNNSQKLDDLSRDIKFVHQDLKDIESEISDKPSRKQFEEFKSKFDNYPTL